MIKQTATKIIDMKYEPDALIFDMDGTLWDAVETYVASWNEYFSIHNIKSHLKRSDFEAYMGIEQDVFLENILPQFSKTERDEMHKEVIKIEYEFIDSYGGLLYEGVIDKLKLLANKFKIFIVSNCPEFTIIHFIKWAKIEEYITETMAYGQNFKSKSENIQIIIDKYSLRKPIYIGDTNSDRIESTKAGVPFVFMEYGFGHCDNYHKKFDSFISFADYYLTPEKSKLQF